MVTASTSHAGNVSNISKQFTNSPDNFHAGKVANYWHNWRQLTSDKFILEAILGVTIDFDEPLDFEWVPPPIPFSQSDANKVEIEIQRLLGKGVIERCSQTEGQFLSNIFLGLKRMGKLD